MPFIETGFRDLKVFEPKVFADSRGYFYEAYNEKTFHAEGITTNWVQDNESLSGYGVLRGLHYQLNPMAQAKMVRVVTGAVLDVVVDIRKGSPTYGKHYKIHLTADNKKQLYIPRGFAHGFAVLSETAIFQYKCDNFYSKEHEGGIIFNDAELGIDWEIDTTKALVSDKDIVLPALANCVNNFQY